MPSSSKKQHNFMEAVAHNPAFAKKAGIPQSVGKDFSTADKGKKFGKGGVPRPDLEKINSPKTRHGEMDLFSKGGSMKKMAKGGMSETSMGKVKTAAPSKDGIAERGKTRAMMPKMAGSTTGMKKGGMAKAKK